MLAPAPPRRLSCIRRWSSDSANSMIVSSAPASRRDLGFARHLEPALGDDVFLDLRRAAADDQTEVEAVAVLPDAIAPRVRGRVRSSPSSPSASIASVDS
jgi:hypothetical protein